MSAEPPACQLLHEAGEDASLILTGDWVEGAEAADFAVLASELRARHPERLYVDASGLGRWDSLLMAFLLRCHDHCTAADIEFHTRDFPEAARRLLQVATAVPAHTAPAETRTSWREALDLSRMLRDVGKELVDSLGFIGELCIALLRLAGGRANTRMVDFREFCYRAGPDAFAIISLTSVLVGMILAYLGAVQLRQFGAQIYVADLVAIGMLREMGALMTAVVMAGRTGAAYAAQLGTMQANDEIDAVVTMGISPVEFLVLPRMLALVAIMPLLTVYANLLGIIGGGIVAGGMGVGPVQYLNQVADALALSHIGVGVIKSFVFAILIAVAGCRAGLKSGRSSAAVGETATQAVVTAIVYLIVADAAINIVSQQLEL